MDIEELQKKIHPILSKYAGVQSASVFGSVARRQENPDSDVDLLVKVEKLPHGIWGMVGLKFDIEEALQKKVDIVSERGITPKFLQSIRSDLVQIYERQ